MQLWQIKLGFREAEEIEFEIEAPDDREIVLKLVSQFVQERFLTHVDITKADS